MIVRMYMLFWLPYMHMNLIFLYLYLFSTTEHVSHGKALWKYNYYYYHHHHHHYYYHYYYFYYYHHHHHDDDNNNNNNDNNIINLTGLQLHPLSLSLATWHWLKQQALAIMYCLLHIIQVYKRKGITCLEVFQKLHIISINKGNYNLTSTHFSCLAIKHGLLIVFQSL